MDIRDNMALLKKAAEGDDEACSQLVSINSNLVWSIARRFMGRGCELEDLYQIGCIGLLKAIRRFDHSYNVLFSTYAVPVITGEIKRYLRDDGMIKVSRPLRALAVKALAVAEALRGELNKEPSISEIAEKLSVEPEELAMAMDACNPPESIYREIDDGEGSPLYVLDRLGDSSGDPAYKIVDRISLKQALANLEPRDRKIILLRYFKHHTQSQVAQELGISQVQVSRLEKSIIKTLKNTMHL